MIKEFQAFLEWLDARSAKKKAARKAEALTKKIEALHTRQKELTIKRDRTQAEYDLLSKLVDVDGDGKTKCVKQWDDEQRMLGEIAACETELKFVISELEELET